MQKPQAQTPKYVFRRNASIGAMDAESDVSYLADCFFTTGDLAVLQDTEAPKRIVVGRVGSGKSALLQKLKGSSQNSIEIRPEDLSLNHISNSDIIQFFDALGVKLDLFYQLLWKHVFVVELLKFKYKISENNPSTFLHNFRDIFKKEPAKKRAIEYLQNWGEKFWLDTELRVKEFTSRLEEQLSSAVKANIGTLALSADAAKKLSSEIKAEVLHKAQSVVNNHQVRELSEIVNFLAEDVFEDTMNRYYIIIDRLDESWVEDRIRYRLVRALIETIRSFQKIRAVKPVISMREDLLQRTISHTRDAGFQEEKFDSLILRLKWSKAQIKGMLDLRVSRLIREQYTQKEILFDEIFKGLIRNESAIDYVFERTLQRPRDAIAFVNACIEISEGKEAISPSAVQDAERIYSDGRFRSIADEWSADYPSLTLYAQILRGRNFAFEYSSLTEQDVENFLSEIHHLLSQDDPLYKKVELYLENRLSVSSLLVEVMKALYLTSIIGMKVQASDRVTWSYIDARSVSDGYYKGSSTLYIHPMLWRALDVTPPSRRTKQGQ